MARGWESKSVEDQIEARREALAAADPPAPQASPAETERRLRREGLLLSRARMAAAIESAANPQYRAMIERAIAHLDSELEK